MAENIVDVESGSLAMARRVVVPAQQYKVAERLAQGKWYRSTFRPVKSKNRARGLDSPRLQPYLDTARTIRLRWVSLERSRTHNAAVFAKQEPAVVA
jgi:hypothetical protein